ncbi:motility protein B [bacterium BMS3Bbin06]|nr:motility protein B [bacterium BMS3Abin08]GBE33870.1 motility protein B [bacterium BMS3Bbin06]HDO34888.1 hypothetical protein [Nitrospirota bacterium]HDY71149.1 hypothetical protein [Nitrospirota bacterium]
MKRHRIEDDENPDRWVVSYADFITLLFALFTILYALSVVDTEKLQEFSNSLRDAMRQGSVSDVPLTSRRVAPIQEVNGRIVSGIRGIIEREQKDISVRTDRRGVVVSIGESFLFPSGSTDIKESSMRVLGELAMFLKGIDNQIMIEGHSDNIPVRNSRYTSNWEISTIRAVRILRLFVGRFGIPPERLIVAGYGEYKPVRENTTPEGRAKNRRVDIVILRDS